MGAYEDRLNPPQTATWLTSTRLIVVVILLAALAPLAVAGWHVWHSRSAALARGFTEADDLVLSLSQHASRSFAEPNLILQDAIEHVENDGVGETALKRLHTILVNHISAARVVRELGILDEHGYWRTSSLPERPTHSNGDRDYFIYHRDNPADKALRINTPVLSRLTGKWTIPVTRRIDYPDGRFAGIALASISADYFQKFYDTLSIGIQGQLILHRSDGELLVQRPSLDGNLQHDRSQNFANIIGREPFGRYHGRSASDGVSRLIAWRQVDDFPLVISVGRAERDVLSDWRSSVAVDITITSAASAIILLLGGFSAALLRRRIAAEVKAAEAGRRYAMIAETASDIIVHVGSDRRRRYISPACRDVLGYDPEDLVERDLFDIAHPDDVPVLQQTLDSLKDGAPRAATVYRARHRRGHYVWVEVTFRVISRAPGESMPEIMASTRDITARKNSEIQLAAAKEAAEIASRAKSYFLSGMSHELRTPLNAIIGFSDLMAREMFGPIGNARYLEYSRDINVSGEHLLQLINDILDHAKVEAGRLELHETVFELEAVFEFLVHMMGLQVERAQLILEAEAAAGIRMFADERRVRQILINLVGNAIKYTPAGGRIRIFAGFAANGDLRLTVSDTGIGMSPTDQAKALQPFTQIDNDRNRSQQGTGLGLTLTRQFIELHGGRLELQSTAGKGTAITVVFPVVRVVKPHDKE